MVEDGFNNKILTCLGVEEQGIELLEYMLHRQGHVTVAAGQVKIILLVGNQITLDGAADVFVEHLVFVPFDDDTFYLTFVDIQRYSQTMDAIGFLFSGNKQQLVAFLVVFFGEEIGWHRIAFIYDIDNGFGHNYLIMSFFTRLLKAFLTSIKYTPLFKASTQILLF